VPTRRLTISGPSQVSWHAMRREVPGGHRVCHRVQKRFGQSLEVAGDVPYVGAQGTGSKEATARLGFVVVVTG
jgi:hypothetical protein